MLYLELKIHLVKIQASNCFLFVLIIARKGGKMQCCTCTLTWYKAQLGVIAHSNYMDPYGMPNFLLFFMFEKHKKFWQSFAGPLSETHSINPLICHRAESKIQGCWGEQAVTWGTVVMSTLHINGLVRECFRIQCTNATFSYLLPFKSQAMDARWSWDKGNAWCKMRNIPENQGHLTRWVIS